jgi:hypothetical protein
MLEYGERYTGTVKQAPNGETFTVCWVNGLEVVVRPFTQDIDTALSLWPEHQRPTSWSGSALDCCRAAIEARRAQWREQRANERAELKRAHPARLR